MSLLTLSVRFVAKAGPIFWLQDQVEAIVQWTDPYKVRAFIRYITSCLTILPADTLLCVTVCITMYVEQVDGDEILNCTRLSAAPTIACTFDDSHGCTGEKLQFTNPSGRRRFSSSHIKGRCGVWCYCAYDTRGRVYRVS